MKNYFPSHLLMKNGAKRGQYIHIGEKKRERLFQLAINTKIWGPDNDNDNVLVVRQCSTQRYIFTGFCLVLIQWLLYTKLSNNCIYWYSQFFHKATLLFGILKETIAKKKVLHRLCLLTSWKSPKGTLICRSRVSKLCQLYNTFALSFFKLEQNSSVAAELSKYGELYWNGPSLHVKYHVVDRLPIQLQFTVGFWCQAIHKKVLQRFDTSFDITMMIKIYAIEIIFKFHGSFQSYQLTGLA